MKRFVSLFLYMFVIGCFACGCNQEETCLDIVKNSVLNEENVHLIGERIVEECEDINEKNEYDFDSIMKTTSIVESIAVDGMLPSSFVEIQIENMDELNVPGQIMVNNSVSILTKNDQTGWNLQEGNVIEFEFEKYESKVIKDQKLLIGYIIDGKMKEYEIFDSLYGIYTHEVEEPGEYYIYLMSASSDYLSIKDSTFRINY